MENLALKSSYLKNPLTLAYLGDAVFTLMVRKHLVEGCSLKPNGLNKKANSVVCAKFQATIMQGLKDELLEDEMDIVMRARNSHLNSKAKNSTLAEYSLATQFEALVGYWYLNNNYERLDAMFEAFVVDELC
ncbi:MAG: ribonuclease III [Clostridia bacterium]|nr:ribonuclease III [Clostridia bacterium]